MSAENSRKRSKKDSKDREFTQRSPKGGKRAPEESGMRRGARFMALLLIALMVIFTFATAGMYLLN